MVTIGDEFMGGKDNSLFVVILIIILIVGIGIGGHTIVRNRLENDKPVKKKDVVKEEKKVELIEEKEDIKEDDTSTFNISEEAGVIYVEGYSVKEHRNGNIDGSSIEYDYILFHITNTDSVDFMKWLENSKGNSFVGEESIGLGCLEDGIIHYYNSTNEEEFKEHKVDKDESEKIVDSTKENTIKLKLERKAFDGGSGAPLCYSHITNMSILK